MAETEYLKLGVDIETRNSGADEAIKKMDIINNKLKALHRTASEAKDYNAGLMGKDALPLMERTLGLADNISDALSSSRSYMSDMASFGANLGAELSSMSSVLSGGALADYSNKSYSELSKLYSRFEGEVAKYREAVNINIASHQFYTTQQLKELDSEEDVVREKMELIKQSMEDLDAQSTGMSFAEFSKLNTDLRETEEKLRMLNREKKMLSDRLAEAIGSGADAATLEPIEASLRDMNKQIVDLETHSQNLEDAIEKYGGYWTDSEVLKQVERMNSAMAEQEKELGRIQTARQRVLNASPADTQRSFARNLTQYENARIKLEQVEEAMHNVGTAGEEAGNKSATGFSATAKAIDKAVRSGWSSFLSSSKKELSGISKFLSNIKKGLADWRKEQKSISEQARGMYKTFTSLFNMLKTRAKRRFVGLVFNDIMTTIGEVAKISPRFNTAVSGFIVSSRTLGAQIIAGLEPLASVAMPLLTKFVDYLTYGAQQLSQFISRATGNLEYIKAIKGQYDYAASLDKTTSSTKKATKAAKEYKNTVMSFDQLHKLNGDDEDLDDLTGLNGVDLEKTADNVDAINALGERFWNAIQRHDFEEAGRTLGEGVNMTFDWLKNVAGWEENSEKFTGIMQNIIDGVNGFIDELSPERIGEAIGDVGNTFIHLFEQWTNPENGFDYYNFGAKLGGILGNAVKTADWDVLGKGIIQGIQGSVKAVNGFMQTTFLNEETGEMETIFAVLGHALSDLLGGMIEAFTPSDWSDLISGLVNGFFEFLAVTFSDPAKAEEFGHKLAQTINETINKLDAGQMTEGINAFTKSFTTLVETAFGDIDFSSAWAKFKEILGGLDWGDLAKTIGIVFAPAFLSGLGSALGSLLKTGGSALLMKYVFSNFMGGAGAGAGAGGAAAAGLGGVVGFFAGVLKFGMILAAIYTAVKGIHTIIELKRDPEKVADDYAKKTQAHKDDPMHVQQAGGITLGTMKGNVRMPTFGELMDQLFQRNYTLEKAEQMGRTRDASLGYDPSNPQGSSGLGNLMAMALNPVMEKFVAPKLQEIKDTMSEVPDTALSNTDSDAFATTLIDGVAEATALPTDSVAGQNSEEFRTFLSEDFRGTVMEAALMLAQEIANKDMTVELDRQVVARSVNSYNANQNKRQNPNWAMAY